MKKETRFEQGTGKIIETFLTCPAGRQDRQVRNASSSTRPRCRPGPATRPRTPASRRWPGPRPPPTGTAPGPPGHPRRRAAAWPAGPPAPVSRLCSPRTDNWPLNFLFRDIVYIWHMIHCLMIVMFPDMIVMFPDMIKCFRT
jgi:hypothetical protein